MTMSGSDLDKNILRDIAETNSDLSKLRQTLRYGQLGVKQILKYGAYALKSGNLNAFELVYQHHPTLTEDMEMEADENLLWVAIGVSEERDIGPSVLRRVLSKRQLVLDYAFRRMVDKNGRCALHHAAEKGVVEVFKFFTELGRQQFQENLCGTMDDAGATPLHVVSFHDNLEILNMLMRWCHRPIADRKGDTILHKAVDRKTPSKDTVQAIVKQYPWIITECNKAGESPLTILLRKKGTKKVFEKLHLNDDATQGECYENLVRYDKTLEEFLMEHALHHCQTLEAVRDILGKNYQDDLYFNASFLRQPATQFPLYIKARKDWRGVDQDVPLFPFLKYVKLPDLQCSARSPCSTTPSGGRACPEAVEVFDYLRERAVSHVDEVIVPDCPIHPHSDEEIKKSLKDIKVRSVHWRKRDLSISSLRHAFQNVERLHLYSSGNNDILEYWANTGLAELKLQNLEVTIGRTELAHIIDEATLDAYRETWATRFQNVVHKNHESPQIRPDTCSKCLTQVKVGIEQAQVTPEPIPEVLVNKDHSNQTQTPKSIVTEMKDFIDFIDDLRNSEGLQHEAAFCRENPIKVAILDSGVFFSPDMRYKPEGRSFIEDETEENADIHWHSPSNSHGTMLARLIFNMNPWSKFYVGKIKHGPHQGGVHVNTAIKALKWAVKEWKPDVICLSWAISRANLGDNYSPFMNAIHSANTDALIFASTSDYGSGAAQPYPAGFNGIFSITAASIDGTPCNMAEDNHTQFYLPSEGLNVEGLPEYLEHMGKKTAEGSSYATALGAGLAAFFLTCVQLVYHTGTANGDEWKVNNELGAYRGENMAKLFKSLCRTGSPRFVQPWHMFRKDWENKHTMTARKAALREALVTALANAE